MPRLSEKTDNELIVLTLADSEVFAVIIERYQEKLRRFVRRISNVSHEDAEDLLQEIFLKIYTNLNGFDPKLSFSSWAYRIARNHTISAFRKKKVRPQTVSWDADDTLLNKIKDDSDLIADIDKKDKHQQLIKAIHTLDHKYRDILVLKYLEEKSYEEIGDILKIPPGTIATRINRAKKHLKKKLATI